MKAVSLIFAGILFLINSPAHASGLLFDSCVVAQAETNAPVVLMASYTTSSGLDCENLESISGAIQWIHLGILPVGVAMKATGASATLAADLAEVGLTMSNPVVLAVTVVGAAGASVFYIVMKKSLDECKAMDREMLKQQLLKELSQKYQLQAPQSSSLELK